MYQLTAEKMYQCTNESKLLAAFGYSLDQYVEILFFN